MNGENKYLKLMFIIAFLAFAGTSCWATAESLHMLLPTWPIIWSIGHFLGCLQVYNRQQVKNQAGSQYNLKVIYAVPQIAYYAILKRRLISGYFLSHQKVCYDKLSSMIDRESTMIIKILLQIRKCAFYLIISIRHSSAFMLLECK